MQPSHTFGMQATHAFASQASLAPLMNSASRVQKRRHEGDDEQQPRRPLSRDASMDRSPPPERPRKALVKRARMTQADLPGRLQSKENKSPGAEEEEHDVDVGVLLANLPPQSLLPMLTALVTQQPQLKRTILNLIPRPTLESALQTLATAAKKLSDSYPYSGPQAPAPTFGFGASAPSPFAQPQQHQPMRESYITDRLRPHVDEFVSACTSYLPYFSYTTTPAPGKPKEKPHAMETYLFLEALTQHVYAQQPLSQASLAQAFLPRLMEEWAAWVEGVDEVVNRQGGMYGSDVVRSWERGLDYFAGRDGEWSQGMRGVRNRWVVKVGWLVGRSQPMEL
ncbi:hypothetical protein BD626DRAFT_407898 [Schizophyllum amplum]|uniref:Tethering factor for nuclear proteasome STS1 n=1 Tax=Schizophyllum amplum TaxID=97359 RepID=A0A550C620_9AGAR|nr:hypothetical protein BD626DRAFT_407898 [Auriculariopsis ampla]